MIWCILWIVLVSDSPAQHRFISKEERDYIISSTNIACDNGDKKVDKSNIYHIIYFIQYEGPLFHCRVKETVKYFLKQYEEINTMYFFPY